MRVCITFIFDELTTALLAWLAPESTILHIRKCWKLKSELTECKLIFVIFTTFEIIINWNVFSDLMIQICDTFGFLFSRFLPKNPIFGYIFYDMLLIYFFLLLYHPIYGSNLIESTFRERRCRRPPHLPHWRHDSESL